MPSDEARQTILTVHAQASGASRTEVLMGRAYRVVPAVLVRSQVLNNNLGPTFLPPNEITPDWADAWNNAVVVAGDHPKLNGRPVSARQPSILNTRGVGTIFAAQAQVEDGSEDRRLVGEVWLEEARAAEVPELAAILTQLQAGGAVELSTGFPCVVENTEGEHNGEAYELVMHPVGVDHLAISSQFTGACSVDDGCGLGVNQEGEMPDEETTVAAEVVSTEEQTDQGEGVWERIRQFFGFALKRAGNLMDGESLSDFERRVTGSLQEQLGNTGSAQPIAIYPENRQVIYYLLTPNGPEPLGDEFFQAGYEERTDGVIVFDQTPVRVRRRVTFEPVSSQMPMTMQEEAETSTNAGDDTGNEEVRMDRQATIAQLAEAGPLSAEQLAQLSDCQLRALTFVKEMTAAQGAAAAGNSDDTAPHNEEERMAESQETAAVEQPQVDPIAELRSQLDAQAEEIRALKAAAAPAVAEQERARTALIDELAGNTKVTAAYSREELSAMTTEQLTKVRALVRGDNFIGQGGPRVAAAQSDNAPQYAEPVPYFAATNGKDGE